jgi:predicted N-acetyltransferase YhbS
VTKSTTETITIRPETPKDYRATENMVREAFWDLYKPGCDEHCVIHIVVHKLREAYAFVKELDFVACNGNRIVEAIKDGYDGCHYCLDEYDAR